MRVLALLLTSILAEPTLAIGADVPAGQEIEGMRIGMRIGTPSAPGEAGAIQEVEFLYPEGVASHRGTESWAEVGNDEVKR